MNNKSVLGKYELALKEKESIISKAEDFQKRARDLEEAIYEIQSLKMNNDRLK